MNLEARKKECIKGSAHASTGKFDEISEINVASDVAFRCRVESSVALRAGQWGSRIGICPCPINVRQDGAGKWHWAGAALTDTALETPLSPAGLVILRACTTGCTSWHGTPSGSASVNADMSPGMARSKGSSSKDDNCNFTMKSHSNLDQSW